VRRIKEKILLQYKNFKEYQMYIYVIICLIITLLQSTILLDTDIWYMLGTGRDIINGGIPFFNEYHITKGLSTVIQQWLYDVIIYKIYEINGMKSIYFFVILESMIIYYLLYKIIITLTNNKKFSLLISSLITIIETWIGGINEKVLTITIILLLLQILIIEKYRISKNKKILFILPILTLIEINMHASMWIFHFLFLLPYIVPFPQQLFKKYNINIIDKTIKIKELIIPIILMIVSLFINPYKIDGVLYLFNSYNDELMALNIPELLPIMCNIYYFLIFVIFCQLFFQMIFVGKKINSTTIYFFLGMSVLSILNVRQFKLMMIILLFLFCDLERIRSYDIFYKKSNHKKCNYVIIIYIIISLLLCVNYQYNNEYFKYENEIIEYLDENEEKDVKIFTGFDTGAYFIWNQYTNTYIDARPELYMKSINKKEDIIGEYIQLLKAKDDSFIKSFIDKYQFEYYIIDKSFEDTLSQYLINNNYKNILENNYYILYQMQESTTTT
jgi:hypothetical protein